MKIEELFGTLQQSITDMWRSHLKTDKHSVHVILNDYYEDMPELVDQLIEDYMGIYGKVTGYKSVLKAKDFDTPADYLSELRKLLIDNKSLLKDSELQSDLDNILSMIDTTLYKLNELVENMFESEKCGSCDKKKKTKRHIKDFIKKDTDVEEE